MRKIRDWKSLIGDPYPIRVYWYGNSLKEERKTKRFRVKIYDLTTGLYLKEIRPCDKIIKGPGWTSWQYVEKEGEYFIYTIIKVQEDVWMSLNNQIG